MSVLRSGNEMLEEAKIQMLGGRHPESKEDWFRIMNFMAANIDGRVSHQCCLILAKVLDMPLTQDEIDAIVEFQLERQ